MGDPHCVVSATSIRWGSHSKCGERAHGRRAAAPGTAPIFVASARLITVTNNFSFARRPIFLLSFTFFLSYASLPLSSLSSVPHRRLCEDPHHRQSRRGGSSTHRVRTPPPAPSIPPPEETATSPQDGGTFQGSKTYTGAGILPSYGIHLNVRAFGRVTTPCCPNSLHPCHVTSAERYARGSGDNSQGSEPKSRGVQHPNRGELLNRQRHTAR